MNFNRKTALRLEIAALPLALASLLAPSAAWAQNSAAPAACEDTDTNGVCDSEETGTIIVTGSRIPRPETDGVIAGVQIDSRKIEERGFTNTLEALNDIPLVGPGASPLTGNNGGQTASLGSAFPDLLDLGTQRTLSW